MSRLVSTLISMSKPETIGMRLHCRSCNTVHALPLADVERIVYALGGMESDAYAIAKDDPDLAAAMADSAPTCLATVLVLSHDGDAYCEHAEQGVASRKASVDAGADRG